VTSILLAISLAFGLWNLLSRYFHQVWLQKLHVVLFSINCCRIIVNLYLLFLEVMVEYIALYFRMYFERVYVFGVGTFGI
jgi:hypothetical protein